MSRMSFLRRPLSTVTLYLWLLVPLGGTLHGGCSNGDESADPCDLLLACCEKVALQLQSQCRAIYNERSRQADAEARCEEALPSFGAQCAPQSPDGFVFPVSSNDGGAGPQADGAPPLQTVDCADLGMSQTLSSPCCPSFGPDACGAQLFCAAFDGRTVPTCYSEYSRQDQTECAADSHCTSKSCHSLLRKCRSMPGAACSGTIGCAAFQGDIYACSPRHDKCLEIGNGEGGTLCDQDAHCDSNECNSRLQCLSGANGNCRWALDDVPLNPGQGECSSNLSYDCDLTHPEQSGRADECSRCPNGDRACADGLHCVFAVWSRGRYGEIYCSSQTP